MATNIQKFKEQNAKNQPRPLYSRLAALPLLLSLLTVYGCAVAVIGLGAGAGAFAYFNGKLTRAYKSGYDETVRAGSATLKRLKIPITDTSADELKTVIRGRRANGTPVTMEVSRVEPNYSQVSVRTGSLGVWDRQVSEQIHAHLSKELGARIATAIRSAEGPASEKRQVSERAENSARAPAQAETDAVSALEEKRLKAARMLVDSPFFIFFEQDSNALSQKSIGKLDRIFEIVAENPAAVLTLNGYSDALGAASYNLMISELRANAVKSYLAGKGLSPDRMTTRGHGARNAIATNQTAEGRSMNRRVEIEITPTAQ